MIPKLEQFQQCAVTSDRWDLIRIATKAADNVQGDWAEFGVAKGKSAEFICRLREHGRPVLHLFDSWRGLPEDWVEHGERRITRGSFACEPPDMSEFENVRIHQGSFEEMLPRLAKREPFAFIHIDCDLESAASIVLQHVPLQLGSVVLFDEFHDRERREFGEARALESQLKARNLRWEYLARDQQWRAAIKIID